MTPTMNTKNVDELRSEFRKAVKDCDSGRVVKIYLAHAVDPWYGDSDLDEVERILSASDVDTDNPEPWDAALACIKAIDRNAQVLMDGQATSETPLLGRAVHNLTEARDDPDMSYDTYLRWWAAAYRAYEHASSVEDRGQVLDHLDDGDLTGAEQAAGLTPPSQGPSV